MNNSITKRQAVMMAISFMLLMIALGINDSLRGIFAPAFEEHFSLSSMQLSVIIMTSYLGNLVFLSVGGNLLDRFNKKTVILSVLALWIVAVGAYVVTDSYYILLVSMFITMGTSTLLSTSISILTPVFFVTSPIFMVNLFYFIQGIGTSGSQNIVGRFFYEFASWKYVNLLLFVLGLISFIMIAMTKIPTMEQKKEKKKVTYSQVVRTKGFFLLIIIFGTYFIAEHGILNWLVTYAVNGLQINQGEASTILSLFFGGIMIGRLLFAPLVQKIGARNSILFFGGTGTALFVLGFLLKTNGLWLLGISGLAVSVIYPTLLLLIRFVFPFDVVATATGAIISIATLFDIGFNLIFGALITALGYQTSIMILPICMAAFLISFILLNKKVSIDVTNK
jgi:fucose permease